MGDAKTCRKWNITINNPLDYGFNHQKIKDCIDSLKSVKYWAMCDEMGSTLHTHIIIYRTSPLLFQTLKSCFLRLTLKR